MYHFAKGLVARGHTVDVFVPYCRRDEHYLPLASLGLSRRVYPWRCGVASFSALRPYLVRNYAELMQVWVRTERYRHLNRRIATDINRGGYDVAWIDACHVSHAPFVLRLVRVPTIYFCHEPRRDGYEETGNEWWRHRAPQKGRLRRSYTALSHASHELRLAYLRQIDQINIRHAKQLVTNSRYTNQYIDRAYGRKAEVSYLGVDTQIFRPLQMPRERLVLSVGRLTRFKRHDLAVQAISRLPKPQRPRMVIVTAEPGGPGFAAGLQSLAQQLDVALDILCGIADLELVRWYNRASVVTYTAIREPFGLVALEAMACGTPVVAVREGGLQESVQDGKTGLLVDATPEAVAGAIQRILDNPGLQRAMGSAGVDTVRQHWTWEAAVDRFERHLYEAAVNRNQS